MCVRARERTEQLARTLVRRVFRFITKHNIISLYHTYLDYLCQEQCFAANMRQVWMLTRKGNEMQSTRVETVSAQEMQAGSFADDVLYKSANTASAVRPTLHCGEVCAI